MKYQDILEFRKRMEFNMTESETLVKLVEDAGQKGEKVQKDMERLGRISQEIAKKFSETGLLYDQRLIENVTPRHNAAVGIDGSFQLVGGAGGKWYAPISVARILFPNGIKEQPVVDIFWAGIEEIDEKDDPKPNIVATIKMLSGESKAILNWGSLNRESYVFIDGPIVDPPVFSYAGKDYIKDRCQALRTCLEKCILIGCVKRSRDNFFIQHLSDSSSFKKEHLSEFPSDQYLIAYVFSAERRRNYDGPLFTKWIDVSNLPPVYSYYKEQGISVYSLFFQKGMMSQILRLDVPFTESMLTDKSKVDQVMLHAAKAASDWTYPGHDYPLPVVLAHDKCNIREGCAEVLYEEILTRSRTTDPRNQIVLSQLR